MTLDTMNLLAVFVGTLVPILNGLLTRYNSSKARAYLQLMLNAAAGFGAEWLDALTNNVAYNVPQAGMSAALALVMAIATQAGVWAPLGVSEWAKTHGRQ